MAISPHIAALRRRVGHDLLLLPSVAVLPWDAAGRLLLVRQAEFDGWATIGGAIEPDETPEESAIRETREEAGVTVELRGIRPVVGGPGCRVRYPNGDVTAYVSIVYDAEVVAGELRPDGEETTAVEWFSPAQLGTLPMAGFTSLLLERAGAFARPPATTP